LSYNTAPICPGEYSLIVTMIFREAGATTAG
jgi:hypothetical protein